MNEGLFRLYVRKLLELVEGEDFINHDGVLIESTEEYEDLASYFYTQVQPDAVKTNEVVVPPQYLDHGHATHTPGKRVQNLDMVNMLNGEQVIPLKNVQYTEATGGYAVGDDMKPVATLHEGSFKDGQLDPPRYLDHREALKAVSQRSSQQLHVDAGKHFTPKKLEEE